MTEYGTVQKMKFCVKDFFIKCDQIRSKLRIWSHLLKKAFMENFIFFVQCRFSLARIFPYKDRIVTETYESEKNCSTLPCFYAVLLQMQI